MPASRGRTEAVVAKRAAGIGGTTTGAGGLTMGATIGAAGRAAGAVIAALGFGGATAIPALDGATGVFLFTISAIVSFESIPEYGATD